MVTTHNAGSPASGHSKNGQEDARINILFIINDLKIGGAEKMLIYLISGLNKKIYNPIVCTLLDRGEYRHYLKTHGIKYYTLNMQNYFKIPVALFKLARIIKKENINLIHSYLFYSDLMARLSGFLTRVPVVITSMRNIDLWRKYHHIFLDSITYKLSSAIISNSLAGAERLYNVERIPSEKIKVVYNAIKLDEYLPAGNYDRAVFRKTLGLSVNDIAITTVARLEEQKDHFTLLRAARHLLDEIAKGAGYASGRALKFLIVGDGSLSEEIRDRAKELKLDESVIFLGQR
ncbi:MAG TPA: glycosyltransferase, partial [Candidatus Wallbacteria bacterium]|nr:glycosyltransferase [Candidatus Wallbacteria bacterium]